MKLKHLLVTGVALMASLACGSSTEGDTCAESQLVLGVQGQPGLSGIIGSYRVLGIVDGVERVRVVQSVASPSGLFPLELPVLSDKKATLSVVVDAFQSPAVGAQPSASDGEPVLRRLATTNFVCGKKKLVRLRLEAPCLVGGFPGALGPVCSPPQTCSEARCVDSTVAEADLEDYTEGWSADGPDRCGNDTDPPEVVMGTGQTDYATLEDGATLQAEAGPQGGHHLWIALRMKNLKQAGSTTTLTATQPGTDVKAPVTSFIFSFSADEGGYCKLFGLRYQLDSAELPIARFLGKELDVTVEVRDPRGRSAKSTRRIKVASELAGR